MELLLILLIMSIVAFSGLMKAIRHEEEIKQYEKVLFAHVSKRQRELERNYRSMKQDLVHLRMQV